MPNLSIRMASFSWDAPGYDPMGATGQIASGANLVVFTTGRGSCFGAKPAPSIKLATNTGMFNRMRDDMDINCGDIMEGTVTCSRKARKFSARSCGSPRVKKPQRGTGCRRR